MSAIAAYESALRVGGGCQVTTPNGEVRELPIQRWLAAAGSSDALLLDRCSGPTLDVGCGPGRLTVSLAQRGVPVLGLDVSAEAVRIARLRGAAACVGDVFGDVPGAGTWRHLLLADGNIGIGGSPVTLLRRARQLIGAAGSIVVDVEPPGIGVRCGQLLVEAHGRHGWLRWARVSLEAVPEVAGRAGLRVSSVNDDGAQRHVVELRCA